MPKLIDKVVALEALSAVIQPTRLCNMIAQHEGEKVAVRKVESPDAAILILPCTE
jgi:hypothetical protein